MNWDKNTQDQFEKILRKIPVFMRGIAKEKVSKKAEELAANNENPQVNEKDLVDAFFEETPFGFHGPMKSDMEEIGIDYKQYGY